MTDELTPEEKKVARSIRVEDHVGGWITFFCSMLVLLGFGVLFWQCVQWLKVAEWPSLSWSDGIYWAAGHGLDLPNARGVEKIMRLIGRLPLFTLPIVVGFGGACLWFNEAREDAERQRVRAKVARIKAQGPSKCRATTERDRRAPAAGP